MIRHSRRYVVSIVLAIVVAAAMAPVASSAPEYPPDMVAYWKFDEGSGAVATDSFNGNDGTVYEATWTTGQVDGALHFDGAGDRVEVAYDPAFKPDGRFTVEAWMYPESAIDQRVIFSALYPAYYQVFIVDNQVALNYYYGAGDYYIVGAEMPALDVWHHIAATYEESGTSATTRIYIDGVERAEFTGEPIIRDPREGAVRVGANYNGNGFIGSIDEVAVYNRALSVEEVQRHYQNGLTGQGYELRMYIEAIPDSQEVYPDDIATVELLVEEADELYGLEMMCSVSPTVLAVQEGVLNDIFDPTSRYVAVDSVSVEDGTWNVAVSLLRPAEPISGDGLFATLTYQAVSPGTTFVTCDVLLSDRDGFVLSVSFVGAEVTVLPFASVDGAATYQGRLDHTGIDVTATGTVTRTDTTEVDGGFTLDELRAGSYDVVAGAPGYLPVCTTQVLNPGDEVTLATTTLAGGDVNDDDVINIGDATLIGNNFGLDVPPGDPQADINADGIVNVQDLAILGGNYELSGCQPW